MRILRCGPTASVFRASPTPTRFIAIRSGHGASTASCSIAIGVPCRTKGSTFCVDGHQPKNTAHSSSPAMSMDSSRRQASTRNEFSNATVRFTVCNARARVRLMYGRLTTSIPRLTKHSATSHRHYRYARSAARLRDRMS